MYQYHSCSSSCSPDSPSASGSPGKRSLVLENALRANIIHVVQRTHPMSLFGNRILRATRNLATLIQKRPLVSYCSYYVS